MPYVDRGKIRLNKHPKNAYARRGVVCLTAVLCVVTQRSYLQTWATQGVPMKAKMWLEESHYRKLDTYTFQKKGAETWLDNMRKGMWFDSPQLFVGWSVVWRHKERLWNRLGGEWPASRLTFANLGKSWCSRRLCRLTPPKCSTKWLKDEPVLRLGGKRWGLGTIGIEKCNQNFVIKVVFT